MNKVFVRSAYNYDMDEASKESGLYCPPEEGMTQQQFAEEVDINTIVKRFGLTGEIPDGIAMPLTGDFTEAKDFQQSMQLLRQAEEAFYELPAETRARFNNDPGAVIAFLDDERNRDEAVRLGMIPKPVEVTRVEERPPTNP